MRIIIFYKQKNCLRLWSFYYRSLALSTRWQCLYKPWRIQNKGLVLLLGPGCLGLLSWAIDSTDIASLWPLSTYTSISLLPAFQSIFKRTKKYLKNVLKKSLCKFIKTLLSFPSTFWNGCELANVKNISLYFRLHLTLKSSVPLSTVVEYLRGSRWVLQPDTIFSDIKKGQVLALTHPSSFLVVIMNAKYLFSESFMISPKCLQSIRFTKKQSI